MTTDKLEIPAEALPLVRAFGALLLLSGNFGDVAPEAALATVDRVLKLAGVTS